MNTKPIIIAVAAPRRRLRRTFAGCAMAALLAVGCATEVGSFTFLKKPYPAKPANFPVESFINDLPTRPFERVAVLDAHCEAQVWMTPNLEKDALPMLIKQARAAGCDAIIEIELRKPSGNWTLETKTAHYTAVGIVWK